MHHFVAVAVDHTGLNRVGMRGFGNGIGLERKFQPLLLRQVEGIAHAQIVGMQPQHARNQGAVGPVSVIGMANEPKRVNVTSTGSPSSRLRTMLAMRSAPAVCEEEGPTIMGPTTSLILIGFMCALLAWPVETNWRTCAYLRPMSALEHQDSGRAHPPQPKT